MSLHKHNKKTEDPQEDVSASIEAALKAGLAKEAVHIAIAHGWFGYATILASGLERCLSEKDKIEIVCTLFKEGIEATAIELGHRWFISRKIPRNLSRKLDDLILHRLRSV